MATIDVRRTHALPKDEARKRAEDLARSMQQRFELDWRWEGDRIVFEAPRGAAKGTRGSVEVGEREVPGADRPAAAPADAQGHGGVQGQREVDPGPLTPTVLEA
jgi:putative polyhydroxyalkanoate system protein